MLQRNKTRAPAYDARMMPGSTQPKMAGLLILANWLFGFARRQYQIILLALVLATGGGLYLSSNHAGCLHGAGFDHY